MPIVGVPAVSTSGNLRDLILGIRDQIPDPVSDAADNGNLLSLSTLLRFINSAAAFMCQKAPIIHDWTGIQSILGRQTYEVDSKITGIDQMWYDLWPCAKTTEYDDIFVTKIQSRSYFFAPHAIHSTPRMHIWPAASRTGLSTTLSSSLTATADSIPMTATTDMKGYGFIKIENEIIRYDTLTSTTLTETLRGQFGTTAVAHNSGVAVTELNIMFKCTRLPVQVTTADSILEIPLGLQPLLEIGVMAKVRRMEQEFQEANGLDQKFSSLVEELSAKMRVKPIQGLQIRLGVASPWFYGATGRTFVP